MSMLARQMLTTEIEIPDEPLEDACGLGWRIGGHTMSRNLPFYVLALALLLTSCSQTASPTPTAGLTATGLTPEENVKKYGIPAIVVPFDYPVPDGMIEDQKDREAMIDAKIAHLQQVSGGVVYERGRDQWG